MLKEEKLQKAYQIIKSSDKVLLIGHLRPDGDALSSVCALQIILKKLNKQVSSFCAGKQIDLFNFLPGFSDIIGSQDSFFNIFLRDKKLINSFDLIIVSDCGSLARTSLSKEIIDFKKDGGMIIEFDHHPKIDDYSDLEIREVNLSSTAELIYDFIETNKIEFNKSLADCILTGLMSDTGNFLYPSATDRTMKIASKSLLAGARYTKVFQAVAGSKDLSAIKLWGLVLDRLQFNPKYDLVFSVVSRKDLNNIFFEKKIDRSEESELFSNLVGFLSNSAEAKIVMLIYEDRDGNIKGSLRSAPNGYPVNKLAQFFGGGGHEKAAGFSFPGKLAKVEKNWQVLD